MADLERSCGPLAFDIFLGSLRRQGFAIGIDPHLRLQQLLASIEKQCGPSELTTVLCPIFATDLEQQKAFYAAFESHFCLFLTAQDEVTSSSSQHVVEHPPSLPA